MRSEQCTITIWGHEDDIAQDVRVRYTVESRDGFFEPVWFVITECKVLDAITVEPSALVNDIELGVQFNEGYVHTVYKMDCKIEYEISVVETVNKAA